jgi:hypothetical protein
MRKRIALLKDGIVFNIIVGPSPEEMAILFDCEAIEVTDETEQAHIGYGFVDGIFEQPPYIEPVVVLLEEEEIPEESLEKEEEEILGEEEN